MADKVGLVASIEGMSAFDAAGKKIDSVLAGIGHQADTTAGKAASMASRVTSSLGNIAQMAAGFALGGIFTAIGGAVTSMAGNLISANADMQKFETTLTTVFRSAADSEEQARGLAKETMAWAAKFSKTTPFEIPEIVEATTRLTSYGLKAKDVLGATGDMAASMGKPLMQAVEAIADAQTGEIERLKEFGITKGMLIDQAAKMGRGEVVSASGQVKDQAALNDALFALMEQRFAGGMARQSATFGGMMSNVQDFMGTLTRTMGAPLFERINQSLQGALAFLDARGPEITAFAELVGEKLGQAFDLLGRGVEAALPILNQLIDWIGKFFAYFGEDNQFDLMRALFGADIGPKIDEVVRSIKNLLGVFGNIVETFMLMLGGGIDFGTWLSGAVGRLAGAYGPYLQSLLGLIGTTLPLIAAQLLEWAQAFVAWITPMIPPFLAMLGNLAAQFIAWLGGQIPPLLAKLGEWAQAFVAWIVPMTVDFLAEWPKMLDGFLNWIAGAVVPILKQLGEWAVAFVRWVLPLIPPLLAALAAVLGALVVWLAETLFVLVGKLLEWAVAFVAWIAPMIPPLLAELGLMLLAIGIWIVNTAAPAIIAKLLEWGKAFMAWVAKVTPQLLEELGKLLGSMTAWIGETATKLLTEAMKMGQSLLQGILDGLGGLKDKLFSLLWEQIQAAIMALKAALGISSPSTVMFGVGMSMADGLALGIESGMGRVAAAMGGLSAAVAMPGLPSLDSRYSMPMPGHLAGAASGSTYNNQQTYQLNAQYSQQQSEASIMDDLVAMQMLANARY